MKRILILSGKQGSGKTSNQNAIMQLGINADLVPRVFKFAAPLYKIHSLVLPVFKLFGWRPETMEKDGELLQELGMFCRTVFGVNCFVDVAKRDISDWLAQSDKHVALIDDCRFENEFDAFPDAFKVRLICPPDVRKARVSYWRENVNHPSETGLDFYQAKSKFDLVWDTEFTRLDVVASGIFSDWMKS